MVSRHCNGIVFIFMVLLTTGQALGASEQARELIQNAIDRSSNATFTSHVVTPKEEVKVYRTVLPDTKEVLERREYFSGGNPILITISSGDGLFLFRDNTVIKMAWENYRDMCPSLDWKWAWKAIQRDMQSNSRYSMVQNGSYYLITMITPLNDEMLAQAANKNQDEIARTRHIYEVVFPVTKKLWIGVNDLFLYRCVMLNVKGKKVTEMNWGNVNFSETLSPELFQLPHSPNSIIKDKNDLDNFSLPGPPFSERMWEFWERNMDFMISMGWYVCIILAILSVGGIIFIKIHQYHTSKS